ncbi:hypothetical protein PMW_28 [Pseudomonas phage phiPMW]|uniref:Uncharacterized protein n=1 Tax=Pseudomonas phage phiPMW TaxID=1815582 RepID=A0A1S5R163_9CAUD|nr:hypothetical protein FDG97_gp028 [Pseudomonas phage phiPMW]ANA49153.1 hypothetical protein PMW_28 [Pseudomonas phage phiPMW]
MKLSEILAGAIEVYAAHEGLFMCHIVTGVYKETFPYAHFEHTGDGEALKRLINAKLNYHATLDIYLSAKDKDYPGFIDEKIDWGHPDCLNYRVDWYRALVVELQAQGR